MASTCDVPGLRAWSWESRTIERVDVGAVLLRRGSFDPASAPKGVGSTIQAGVC